MRHEQTINQEACLDGLQKLAQEVQNLQQERFSCLEKDLLVDELYGRCAQLADSLDVLEQKGVEIEALEQQYIDILLALSQFDQTKSERPVAHQSNQRMSLLSLMPPLVP